jgi:2-enoate reductase
MATGSAPSVPDIPGVEKENVSLATAILEGKKILGDKIIVIGGGQVGLETADFLAEAGKEVVVIEMLGEIGIGMPPRNKMFLMKKLEKEGVQILANRNVKEIFSHGVRVDHFGHQEEFTGDAIVLATGSKPERILLRELEEFIPELGGVFFVGDCIEPRTALEAVYEGMRIAEEI